MVSFDTEARVVNPPGTTYDMRLCTASLSVAQPEGLPCARVQHLDSHESVATHLIGGSAWTPVCPAFGGGNLVGLAAYEFISTDPAASGATVEVAITVTDGNRTLHSSTKNFIVQGSSMAGLPLESASGVTDTEPFFTHYPLLTTRNRLSEEFDAGEIIFVQFIVKPKPLTRADYSFVLTPSGETKICRVEVDLKNSSLRSTGYTFLR